MSIFTCGAICAFRHTRGRIVQPTDHYTYQQIQEDLEALQKRYPDLLRVASIGESREGRDIYAAIAGAPGSKHHVLIQGSIHGREHMTSTLIMMQLEELLRKGIFEDVAFHMIPVANPDGVHISQTGCGSALVHAIYLADVDAGYSTPPEREALRDWKANGAGVDLNRNFDAGWDRINTRPGPSGEGYRGPGPESEPETRALKAYTKRFPFAATISYHATGSEIFYEFGPNSPVNEKSRSLAEAVRACTKYELLPDSGTSFGGYKDWAIEKRGVPSLTVEVGKGATPLDISEYTAIWKQNRKVPEAIVKWVLGEGNA